MEVVKEFRLTIQNGSLDTTKEVFGKIERSLSTSLPEKWKVDEENQEGLRIRTGSAGGYFMLRPSLHDPLISFQLEGSSLDDVKEVVETVLYHIEKDSLLNKYLPTGDLHGYCSAM